MAEVKEYKTASRKVKQRLMAEFSSATADTSLSEWFVKLGIPKKDRTEDVLVAVSALIERIEDTSRELVRARADFNELEQLVDVDCLAPVPNRRALMRRLNWAISMFSRYGHPCSILYFDLNGFKQINDEHTHAAGDEVIRSVAGVLSQSLRESDFMARMGGDEFVVLLYYAKFDAARKRAAVIARKIAENTINWDGIELKVTASCGAYEIRQGDTAEIALAQADKAMYAQKKAMTKSH